jgi:diguanylate cyclase (GGDEF)-like protein
MNALLIGTLALVLGAGFLAGSLAARRRIEREKRRADGAEARERAYFSVIEILSGGFRQEGTATPSGKKPPEAEATLSGIAGAAPAAGPAPSRLPSPAAADSASESRYLFVSFEQEIRRAEAQGRPLTLVALEALPSGAAAVASEPAVHDRFLRGVAHALRGQMRGCDTCIRHAARDFILVLPGVSRVEARRVEARLRTALLAVSVEPRPGTEIRVHPALGSASYPDDGNSFDQLLTVADRRRSSDAAPDLPGSPSSPGVRSVPWKRAGTPN